VLSFYYGDAMAQLRILNGLLLPVKKIEVPVLVCGVSVYCMLVMFL
jgi:hypothetical protein